jgi:hypothetical protein
MRIRTVFIVSLAAGGLGATWTTSDSLFVQIGCGLFWFIATFLVLIWARHSRAGGQSLRVPNADGTDYWTDEQGVHHFHGDVFDLASETHRSKHAGR